MSDPYRVHLTREVSYYVDVQAEDEASAIHHVQEELEHRYPQLDIRDDDYNDGPYTIQSAENIYIKPEDGQD